MLTDFVIYHLCILLRRNCGAHISIALLHITRFLQAQLDTDAQEQIADAGAISALLGVAQAAFITKALLTHSAARRAHRRQQSSGDVACNAADSHHGYEVQDGTAITAETGAGAPTLPTVVQYVAGALWNLSNLGGACRDELGERGGMGLLVQLAATEDEMLQLYCAGTIANGCLRHAGNKRRLRNVGGVQVLRKLLDSSAPKVRRTAAVALRNATFSDKPNQAELRASGGVLRLLDLLADADLKAATAAVATLMNCTHEDLRSRQQVRFCSLRRVFSFFAFVRCASDVLASRTMLTRHTLCCVHFCVIYNGTAALEPWAAHNLCGTPLGESEAGRACPWRRYELFGWWRCIQSRDRSCRVHAVCCHSALPACARV